MNHTLTRVVGATLAALLFKHAAAEAVTELEYDSAAFSETREILVSLPADYFSNPNRRYPVLYVLNERENFEWAADIVDFLAAREEIDELIVVSLPSDDTYGRDNTPFASPETTVPNDWAERYEMFIRQEAVPYIDQTFRTNEARYIAGHSLSGLFVTNLFVDDPDGFQVHLAISPSYHQFPQIVGLMRKALDSGEIDSGVFYLAVGDLEHSLMRSNVESMVEALREHAPDATRWRYSVIEHNNHRSTAGSGLYDSLSWMFAPWAASEELAADRTLDEVIAHYDDLADLLGYHLPPREGGTLGLAAFLLRRVDDLPAALNAYRIAQHYYPDADEATQMILLLEPWLEGGAQAVSESLRAGANVRRTTILDLVNVLLNRGRENLAAELATVAAEFFPDLHDGNVPFPDDGV